MLRPSMYRVAMLCTFAVCVSLVCAHQTMAQTDPQIFTCQSCTKSPGGEPNPILNTSGFNVGWDGSQTSAGPLLIIIGVYSSTGGTVTAPTLSYGPGDTLTTGPGGSAIYGWNGAQGVSFSAANGTTNAYSVLGISPQDGGSSEQFGNWIAHEPGAPATGTYTLYVYEINEQLPSGTSNMPITLDLSGGTQFGDYVISYGCEPSSTGSAQNPCPSGDEGATPFTNAGLVGVTPEPTTMLLFGTGLVTFGGMLRRRKSGNPVAS
jgi:hypothetical protein